MPHMGFEHTTLKSRLVHSTNRASQVPCNFLSFLKWVMHPHGTKLKRCKSQSSFNSYYLVLLFEGNHNGFRVYCLRLNSKTGMATSFLYILPKIGYTHIRKYSQYAQIVYTCIKCSYIYIYINVCIYTYMFVYMYTYSFLFF